MGNTPKFIQSCITLNCFTSYTEAILLLVFILELSNLKKEKIRWQLNPSESKILANTKLDFYPKSDPEHCK